MFCIVRLKAFYLTFCETHKRFHRTLVNRTIQNVSYRSINMFSIVRVRRYMHIELTRLATAVVFKMDFILVIFFPWKPCKTWITAATLRRFPGVYIFNQGYTYKYEAFSHSGFDTIVQYSCRQLQSVNIINTRTSAM